MVETALFPYGSPPQPLPDPAAERERVYARRHPVRSTLEPAAAGVPWAVSLTVVFNGEIAPRGLDLSS